MIVQISHNELVRAVLKIAVEKHGILPDDAKVFFRWGDPNMDEISATVETTLDDIE